MDRCFFINSPQSYNSALEAYWLVAIAIMAGQKQPFSDVVWKERTKLPTKEAELMQSGTSQDEDLSYVQDAYFLESKNSSLLLQSSK